MDYTNKDLMKIAEMARDIRYITYSNDEIVETVIKEKEASDWWNMISERTQVRLRKFHGILPDCRRKLIDKEIIEIYYKEVLQPKK